MYKKLMTYYTIFLLVVLSVMPNVYSNEVIIDESLLTLGFTESDLLEMDEETKSFYENIELDDTVETIKYFRVEQFSDNFFLIQSTSDNNIEIITELSEEEFLNDINRINESEFQVLSRPSDSINIYWLSMRTTISRISGTNDFLVINDVDYVIHNGFMQVNNTHTIGIGVNSNFSVIAGSEYLRHTYDYLHLNGNLTRRSEFLFRAYKRSAAGYAFVFNVNEHYVNNRVYMAVRISPNQVGNLIADAYGHYARDTISYEPTISFASDGASISITPIRERLHAPNTHVQLRL